MNVLNSSISSRDVQSGTKTAFILIICGLGFAFELGELGLGSALLAIMSQPPHDASPSEMGWLAASSYLGAVLGAPLAGYLADRFGRRRLMAAALLWLAAASLGASTAPDVEALIAWRVACGVSLGAFPPLVISYLSETLPAARRGRLILIVAGISALGAPLLLFLLRWLTPISPFGIEAWRWVVAAGAVGAGVSGWLAVLLPESRAWLAALAEQSRRPQASAGKLSAVVQAPFAFSAALFALAPWATIAFPMLSSAVLLQRGVQIGATVTYLAIASFGPVVGTLLCALVIEKVARSKAVIATASLSLATVFAFLLAESEAQLAISLLCYNLAAAALNAVLFMYVAELFPTVNRATSTSAAWSVNRVCSVFAPLVCTPILLSFGPLALGGVVAVALSMLIAITLGGPAGNAGRSIE